MWQTAGVRMGKRGFYEYGVEAVGSGGGLDAWPFPCKPLPCVALAWTPALHPLAPLPSFNACPQAPRPLPPPSACSGAPCTVWRARLTWSVPRGPSHPSRSSAPSAATR